MLSLFCLQLIRNIKYQPFGLFPAKTRVGNGFTENVLLGLASAVLKVALDHNFAKL